MRITDQIKRIVKIANKVSLTKVTSKEELIRCACQNLSVKNIDITTRTLQRDFEYIDDLFGIKIAYDRSAGGYIIKERGKTASEYEILLQNFELLSRIDNDSVLMDCVISEHRRPPLGECFQEILDAIYTLRSVYPNILQLTYDNSVTRNELTIGEMEKISISNPMQMFEEFYLNRSGSELKVEQKKYVSELIDSIWGSKE